MASQRKAFTASPPRILSIAGSDPSGGAGIQADLKTIASLGCYGMCALTALTAQNTKGVSGIHVTPTDFFRSQLQSLWDDIQIDAIKIGMLGNREIINALNEELKDKRIQNIPIVIDPVMVSTSGSLLLTHESIADLIRLLLPKCSLLTPNLPEAKQLLEHAKSPVRIEDDGSLASLMEAAQHLTTLGPKATLVKGGHHVWKRSQVEASLKQLGISLEGKNSEEEKYLGAEVLQGSWQNHKVTIVRTDLEPYADILRNDEQDFDPKTVADVLFDSTKDHLTVFIKPHIQSSATHGTGCTLSSALAVNLTSSATLTNVVHSSIQYVQRCIYRGLSDLGHGVGPLNHLCGIQPRPILPPTDLPLCDAERYPLCSRLISCSLPIWRAFTQHPFLAGLVDYSLPRESFIYFLQQDYIFLKHYARVWASGASSFTVGNTFERIATFAGIAAEMAAEADNHVKICQRWGISREQLETTVESSATLAYTRFVLDVSRSGDALELLAATGPCLLGYGEAGRWIVKEQSKRGVQDRSSEQASAFQDWVEYYAGQEFQKIVRDGIQNMERYAANDPPSLKRTATLQRIWDAAVRLEIGMWDEALNTNLRRDVLSS